MRTRSTSTTKNRCVGAISLGIDGSGVCGRHTCAPSEMLGAGPEIGVWAAVSVRRDGELVQVDRGGHPTINPFVNPNNVKDQFNARQQADDVANYLQPWSKLLEENGHTPDEAAAAARIVLPPHDDLLAEFPYLGPPNLYPAG